MSIESEKDPLYEAFLKLGIDEKIIKKVIEQEEIVGKTITNAVVFGFLPITVAEKLYNVLFRTLLIADKELLAEVRKMLADPARGQEFYSKVLAELKAMNNEIAEDSMAKIMEMFSSFSPKTSSEIDKSKLN